jgi:pimeloyl-ACP methyl ester carboxylesterase/DNA-binding CsgD family transcriptional regulator
MCDGPFQPLRGGWEAGAASALVQRFRVVRFDHRGTGASRREAIPTVLNEQVMDLEAVVAAVTDQPVALLGYSHGGHAALTFAARHPERVNHLIVYGSPGPYQTERSAEQIKYDRMFDDLLWQGFERKNLLAQRTFAMAFVPTAPTETIDRAAADLVDHMSTEAVLAYNDASRSSTVEDVLPAIVTRTLVCHRPDDPLEFVDGGQQIASLIRGARFQALAGSDHLLRQGQPELEEFARCVTEFVLGKATDRPDGLTGRELEVLRLVASGKRNVEIAETLVISPATVTRHVSNILKKTVLSNRTELARYAARRHLDE